jgi:hypothetical protein
MSSIAFEDPYSMMSKEEIDKISNRISRKVAKEISKQLISNLKKI